jgi:curved DNA-binding protein CbpA
MQLIETQTLGSSQAAITFSSIPQTFTDLFLQVSVRSTNSDDGLFFKFNNTTANTSWRNLLGYGTGTLSQSGSGWLAGGGVRSGTSSTFTNIGVYIPNYTASAAKTASVDSTSEENSSTGYQFLVANLWNDTTAINRIDFYLQGGSLTQYSSVSLYGILKGSSGGVTVS